MKDRTHLVATPRSRRIAPQRDRDGFIPQRLEARQLLAAVAWDGEALDGDWHNPLNWLGDVLPAEGDDVTIAAGAGPAITLAAGNSATIRSLDLDRAFSIAGTLTVAGQTRIGDTPFAIEPEGDLTTNDLTLDPSAEPITSAGVWRITGTGLIDRRIQSTGALNLAADSITALGSGLGLAGQIGSIEALEGVVNLGSRARISGDGPQVAQIIVGDWVNVGAAASFHAVGIVARGTGIPGRINVKFSSAMPATITGSALRLGFAYVRGQVGVYDSAVTIDSRTFLSGQTRIERGSLDVLASVYGGWLETTDTVVTLDGSAQPGQGIIMEVDGRLVDGQVILRSDARFTRPYPHDGLAIHSATISGPFTLDARTLREVVIEAETTVTATRVGQLVPLLYGTPAMIVHGRFETNETLWDSGSIRLAVTQARLEVGDSLTIASGSGTREVRGPGRMMVIEGGRLINEYEGEAVIASTLTTRGTIDVRAGTLRIAGDLVRLTSAGTLGASTWIVGSGATLLIDEGQIVTNRADITVGPSGALPALAGMVLNSGAITLDGAGVWATGSDNAVTFTNAGVIRKMGQGVRWVRGDIIQPEEGRLEINMGRLRLETHRFHNAGSIVIGVDNAVNFVRRRASLEVTGDFTQDAGAAIALHGAYRDGFSSLPRLVVGGTMTLDGVLIASIHPKTLEHHPTNTIWRFASAARRNGAFAQVTITIPGAGGALTYTPTQALITVIR